MSDARITRHPSADIGEARKAIRDGDFEGLASAIRSLVPEGSATEIALTEVLEATTGMTRDEQIKRAADALIRAYLPESWERVLFEARRMEEVSGQPEFARAVRIEVERRHNEQKTD